MDAALSEKGRLAEYYDSHPNYYKLLVTLHGGLEDVDGRRIESLIRAKGGLRTSGDYRILDVGCGAGLLLIAITRRLYQARMGVNGDVLPDSYGIDICKHAIATAEEENKSKLPCHFTQWDAEDVLPFADGTFDTVYSTYALEHMVEPGKVLDGMMRVVAQQGFIYLSFPGMFKCFSNPWATNGIPIKDRLLKAYDAFMMLLNRKYVKFRYVRPSLDGVCEDNDMVFLTFTPEIVRYLEQRGFLVVDYDMRGRVVAVKEGGPRTDPFRSLRYFCQFVLFAMDLVSGARNAGRR